MIIDFVYREKKIEEEVVIVSVVLHDCNISIREAEEVIQSKP